MDKDSKSLSQKQENAKGIYTEGKLHFAEKCVIVLDNGRNYNFVSQDFPADKKAGELIAIVDVGRLNDESLSQEGSIPLPAINKTFDKLEGCINYDGSGVELLKEIRKEKTLNNKKVRIVMEDVENLEFSKSCDEKEG